MTWLCPRLLFKSNQCKCYVFYVKTRKMSRTEGLTDFNALHKDLCLLWDYREKIKYIN